MTVSALDTPMRRYGALSGMLSGVKLIPRGSRPPGYADFFPAAESNAFCGRWHTDDIYSDLDGTGCLAHWKNLGFQEILIEISPHVFSDRHELTVWTRINGTAEILMQIVVWLDFVEIQSINAVLPSFGVEHLRLQTPGAPFDGPRLPGQDYASSGLLRRIFAIVGKWAAATGAQIITEIPEYFHTAYIFSQFFQFADPEMESIFQRIKSDLVPDFSHQRIADVSRAFEDGRIIRDQHSYLWPTELQVYALEPEIKKQLDHTDHPDIPPGTFIMT